MNSSHPCRQPQMTPFISCLGSELEAFSNTTTVQRRWLRGTGIVLMTSTGVLWQQRQKNSLLFALHMLGRHIRGDGPPRLSSVVCRGAPFVRPRHHNPWRAWRATFSVQPTIPVSRVLAHYGMRLVAVGVVIGLALAIGLARVIESFLFGVETWDPTTFVTVPAVLASVALVAVLVPAHRASRVNPVDVLRYE